MVYTRNVVNLIRLYYVLCLILFCFVVDLFITSTTHPTNTHTHIYIYIYIYICVCVCACRCACTGGKNDTCIAKSEITLHLG